MLEVASARLLQDECSCKGSIFKGRNRQFIEAFYDFFAGYSQKSIYTN